MLHLLKIEEIRHLNKNGLIIWESKNINNIFHINGQEFLLRSVFNTAIVSPPASYYLGLDNRSNVVATDSLPTLMGEPTQNGYTRQPVSSVNGFAIAQDNNGNFRATSSIVAFTATGGPWGPVRNLFLATVPNDVGYLLSTAPLDTSRTVNNGESLTMRISVGLLNC